MQMNGYTASIVRRYGCHPGEFPDQLYRVQYDGSMSLRARADPVFQSSDDFKRAVEYHLDWSNRVPTPFVSTFADSEHAENWANDRIRRGYAEEAVVLELDPDGLDGIFSVDHLVEDRGVYTDLPRSMYRDECLVLDEIPRMSIIRRLDPRDDDSSADELARGMRGLNVRGRRHY